MENNKRKEKEEGETCEVEEEMKMDMFYSLLRNFRDARNRRRKELEEMEINKKRKMMRTEQQGWVPSFERRDFINDIQFTRPSNLIFPFSSTSPSTSPSPRGTDKRKKGQCLDHSLDLKLSL